jgi:hypothetical protein
MFGSRMAGLVAAVTNPAWEPGRDEDEPYREHVAASLEASPWAGSDWHARHTDRSRGPAASSGPRLRRHHHPSRGRRMTIRAANHIQPPHARGQ